MGMKSPAKKKEIVKRSRPTDAELGKIDSNNGDAGKIISDLTAGHKSIEYEARDIALYDIRVNADNEIFRQADTQEDIVQLAEDIQRNGLMHNLVVFPQEENGKTVVEAVLMTASTAVFSVFWRIFTPESRKNLFCLGRQKRFIFAGFGHND